MERNTVLSDWADSTLKSLTVEKEVSKLSHELKILQSQRGDIIKIRQLRSTLIKMKTDLDLLIEDELKAGRNALVYFSHKKLESHS